MEPVLVDHGPNRRPLGALMPGRLGVITGHGVAPAALWWLTVDDLAGLLGRERGADGTSVAGLTASLLARSGGRRTALDRGGSEEGGLEELVESRPSRSTHRAIRRPEDSANAETAAFASADMVSQMD